MRAYFLLVLVLSSSAGFLFNREVCYGFLGCFSNNAPFRSFSRLISFLPQGPEVVRTRFRLFTRANPTVGSEDLISYEAPQNISKTRFLPSRKTFFCIHGFMSEGVLDKAHQEWKSMVSHLLQHGDYNVIAVDWKNGNKLPYTQATANTRLVGAQLAFLLVQLQKFAGLKMSDVHLVGHSLGAHIAGYAGQRVSGVGRITGLDPADPYFSNTDPLVRLDPSDALFVDVIHTDAASFLALGLGSSQAMGHVDFYPNGGSQQPDCPHAYNKLGDSALQLLQLNGPGIGMAFSCSHNAATRYFINSINSNCTFSAYSCSDWDTFKQGKCLKCNSTTDCSAMGFHTQPTARGKQFLATGGKAPFCRNHYSVSIRTAQTALLSSGGLTARIEGKLAASKALTVLPEGTRLAAGQEFSTLVTPTSSIGEVSNLTLKFQKSSFFLTDWIYPDKTHFSLVRVTSGETQRSYESCMHGSIKAQHDTEEVILLNPMPCSP